MDAILDQRRRELGGTFLEDGNTALRFQSTMYTAVHATKY